LNFANQPSVFHAVATMALDLPCHDAATGTHDVANDSHPDRAQLGNGGERAA
jgi:hypothetical protein